MKLNHIIDVFNKVTSINTHTIPFMLGLFIGMTVIDPDMIHNALITAISGGAFHVTKAIFSLHA